MNPPNPSEKLSGPEPDVRLMATLDAMPDAIVTVDPQGRIVFINTSAERVFDCRRAEVVGNQLPAGSALVEVLSQLDLKGLAPSAGPAPARRQVQLCWPAREPFSLEAVATCVEVNQEVIYPVVIRPVSQQKQQAQALNQSQKAQAIGALASGVAHDFNNILTAILSHLDLVADSKELPPLLRESVHHAQNSARRGAELVSKLMTFSHRSEPKLAPLNLHKLITDMVGMLRRNIDPRIQIRVSPETPEVGWVQADESQIMQMLMYLCLNVRDAMPHGGELAIILEDVTFMGSNLSPPRRAGDFVRLTVSDTGEAMPPEVLGRLFEPYFATKILHKGVGLGLSIAYNIVIGHGGWLEVASRVGQGNQFHVYLPLTRETEKREPELAHELSEADTQALEGKEKVLVADDEELVRLVVRAVLSYRGYQIVEATNGEEAIKLYREASPPYDLVLLDVHMPNLNGWETLVRLRQLDPGVTAILLSGGLTDEENEKAVKLGAASLLPKPFDNLNLLRLVRKTLDAAQSKRTAGAA